MSEDKELYNFFKSGKKDIADKGFSQDVMRKLPQRMNILPYLIIVICAVSGLLLTVSIVGADTFTQQINSLAISLSRMQIPSLSSITAYIAGLISIGTISFAVYRIGDEA